MTRVLFIPLVLVLAVPAWAGDDLEAQLKQIEARVAKLRAEAQREAEASAQLDLRIAALAKQIEERKKADPTALGATKIADLQVEREKLESAKRSLRRDLARESRSVTETVASIQKDREPVDLESLVKSAQSGDAKARGELAKIQARIMAVLGAPAQQGAQQGWVALGNGNFQVINRAVVRVAAVPVQQPSSQPVQPAQPKKVVPPEEQKKRGAEDLTDQQKRAAELEARIVEMTRKLMELERRVEELKQKVAQPDRG